MTPSSPSPTNRTATPGNQQANVKNISLAQEDLIYFIKNIHEEEFHLYLDKVLEEGVPLDFVDDNGLSPLEIAVMEHRPRIAQDLLNKNALLPFVKEDGFDLVMLSASCGDTAMLSVLIDKGSMLSDAQDNKGLTPLHYAVMGGHLQAAIALIDREADIDIRTTEVLDTHICQKFGLPQSLAEKGTTPLMLAVSTGNLALADLLLSRYADVTAGSRHPLEIAIIKNDSAMIGLFIQKGIDPTKIKTVQNQSMLSLAIESQCSLFCIKQLLPPGTRILDENAKMHSPLRIAVRTGQHEVAAYLLCQGAQAESVSDLFRTTWEFAGNLPDQGKMTQILVATRCACAVQAFIQSNRGFIELYQMAQHPQALAVCGFFPELLTNPVNVAQAEQSVLHQLTPAQQTFEIAYLLMSRNKPSAEIDALLQPPEISILPIPEEQRLIQSIPEKIKTQKNELYQWAKSTIDKIMMPLPDCFSKNFLVSMIKTCPRDTDLSVHMMRQLRERNGFPNNLTTILVSAWSESNMKVNQWHLQGADAERIYLCKEYYAMNRIEDLLFTQLQAQKTEKKTPSYSRTFAYQTIVQRTLPLNQFAENPVIFINKLEQSLAQQVADVSSLTTALCLATGLTPPQSEKIIELWKEASRAAALAFPANDVEKRHHFLCRAMAASIKMLLPAPHSTSDGTAFPMTLRWQLQLQQWCDSTLSQETRVAANDSDGDDIEESRPYKRPRYEHQ